MKYNIYTAYRSQALHHQYLDKVVRSRTSFHNQVDDHVHERELGSAAQAMADQLPEKCRQVYVYSREQFLSQKEIADKLGISVSTVKKHLTKALRMMRVGLRHFFGLLFFFF